MSRPRENCHDSTPTAMRLSRAPIVGPSRDSVNVPLCCARQHVQLIMQRHNDSVRSAALGTRALSQFIRVVVRCSPSPKRANGGKLIGNRPVIAIDPSKARAAACCDA
jgi:hypothetical protein